VVRNAELRPLFHSHETEIKELNRKVVKWERAYTTAGSAVPVKFQPRTWRLRIVQDAVDSIALSVWDAERASKVIYIYIYIYIYTYWVLHVHILRIHMLYSMCCLGSKSKCAHRATSITCLPHNVSSPSVRFIAGLLEIRVRSKTGRCACQHTVAGLAGPSRSKLAPIWQQGLCEGRTDGRKEGLKEGKKEGKKDYLKEGRKGCLCEGRTHASSS
jgi:hypothetical protein